MTIYKVIEESQCFGDDDWIIAYITRELTKDELEHIATLMNKCDESFDKDRAIETRKYLKELGVLKEDQEETIIYTMSPTGKDDTWEYSIDTALEYTKDDD